jgi:hypothetical protein
MMGDLQTVPLSEVIARLRASAQGLSTGAGGCAAAPRRAERDHPETAHPVLEFARYFWAPIP